LFQKRQIIVSRDAMPVQRPPSPFTSDLPHNRSRRSHGTAGNAFLHGSLSAVHRRPGSSLRIGCTKRDRLSIVRPPVPAWVTVRLDLALKDHQRDHASLGLVVDRALIPSDTSHPAMRWMEPLINLFYLADSLRNPGDRGKSHGSEFVEDCSIL